MTIDGRLDRLTGIVESLAESVVEHTDQIGGLIEVAEKHQEEIEKLRRSQAEVNRLFEAYLKRLPPQ
jgi:hypothetical protein